MLLLQPAPERERDGCWRRNPGLTSDCCYLGFCSFFWRSLDFLSQASPPVGNSSGDRSLGGVFPGAAQDRTPGRLQRGLRAPPLARQQNLFRGYSGASTCYTGVFPSTLRSLFPPSSSCCCSLRGGHQNQPRGIVFLFILDPSWEW